MWDRWGNQKMEYSERGGRLMGYRQLGIVYFSRGKNRSSRSIYPEEIAEVETGCENVSRRNGKELLRHLAKITFYSWETDGILFIFFEGDPESSSGWPSSIIGNISGFWDETLFFEFPQSRSYLRSVVVSSRGGGVRWSSYSSSL
jgi:hypothetical protein